MRRLAACASLLLTSISLFTAAAGAAPLRIAAAADSIPPASADCVWLEGEAPAVESITSVWPSANFYEREVFDLFGVRFEGHPNLKHIVLWDGFKGNPLRKDFLEW